MQPHETRKKSSLQGKNLYESKEKGKKISRPTLFMMDKMECAAEQDGTKRTVPALGRAAPRALTKKSFLWIRMIVFPFPHGFIEETPKKKTKQIYAIVYRAGQITYRWPIDSIS